MVLEIREYSKADEKALFEMLRKEGKEWEDYWGASGKDNYRKALDGSIAFVAYDGSEMCGYVRCKKDESFGVYIYDLLVTKTRRGENIGRALMDEVCSYFPHETVYVMSGIDDYYEKQGYRREGTIFKVSMKK
jgi:ribosomal protein S18 acetylase RimI-like enzyme